MNNQCNLLMGISTFLVQHKTQCFLFFKFIQVTHSKVIGKIIEVLAQFKKKLNKPLLFSPLS